MVDEQAQELRNGRQHVKGPRSAAGHRVVSLPAFVAVALAEHLDRYVAPESDAWLFTGTNGRLVRRGVLHARWDRARIAVGLPDVTMHDLRHAGATLAAWTGASTRDLMARPVTAAPEPPCATSTPPDAATARSLTASVTCST